MTDKKAGEIPEDRILGRFQKSVKASIQVALVEWEGADYLDIREVIPSDKPGEPFTFTRKGIRMKAELAGNLLELLGQVPPELRQEGGEAPGQETSS